MRETKISDLGPETSVHQDILALRRENEGVSLMSERQSACRMMIRLNYLGFEITVQDRRLGSMEELDTLGDVSNDL